MSTDKNQVNMDDGEDAKSHDEVVADLISELDGVDTDSEESRLNATSISDNNGGRIELDEPLRRSKRVQGRFSTDGNFQQVNPKDL